MVLPTEVTGCFGCPYGLLELCDGPTTRGSFYVQGDKLIGCRDGKRILEHYSDLHREFQPAVSSNQTHLTMPEFIPLVSESKMDLTALSTGRLLGVSLGDILNDTGRVGLKSPKHLRERLKVAPSARLALIGTSMDWKLERFWTESKLDDSWRRLVDLEFEFVTSATFSIYYEDARSDQIYSRERNMFTHDTFSSLGVPSIPFILFSKEQRDYAANINWLRSRTDITDVALLGQQWDAVEFDALFDELQSINNDVVRPIHFLVVGPSEANRITTILSSFNATIATSRPFQAALHGERASRTLEFEEDHQPTKESLVENNVKRYENHCHSISVLKNNKTRIARSES